MDAKEEYRQYLQTPYWKQVSDAVKARAGYRCQICNRPDGLEAHHRSYAHRGNELEHLGDLTCLCRKCHGLYHRKKPEDAPAPKSGPRGMAKARAEDNPPPPKPVPIEQLFQVTNVNRRRIKTSKPAWHYLTDKGFSPRKAGWNKRLVGQLLPKWCFHGNSPLV